MEMKWEKIIPENLLMTHQHTASIWTDIWST